MARRAARRAIPSKSSACAGARAAVATEVAVGVGRLPSSRAFLGEAQSSDASIPVAGRASAGHSTAEVVAKAIAGDRNSFRTLVEEYYVAVFGLCRKLLCGREHEAEEVAQDTFLNAYRYLATLADPARFSNWLYQIARSLCRDRRRRWQVEERALQERRETLLRQPPGEQSHNSFYREEYVEIPEDPEDAEWLGDESPVGAALSDLPREERRVLLFRYFYGLSYEEISEKMRLSFSQVDHLIRKARARFARRFAVRKRAEEKQDSA